MARKRPHECYVLTPHAHAMRDPQVSSTRQDACSPSSSRRNWKPQTPVGEFWHASCLAQQSAEDDARREDGVDEQRAQSQAAAPQHGGVRAGKEAARIRNRRVRVWRRRECVSVWGMVVMDVMHVAPCLQCACASTGSALCVFMHLPGAVTRTWCVWRPGRGSRGQLCGCARLGRKSIALCDAAAAPRVTVGAFVANSLVLAANAKRPCIRDKLPPCVGVKLPSDLDGARAIHT